MGNLECFLPRNRGVVSKLWNATRGGRVGLCIIPEHKGQGIGCCICGHSKHWLKYVFNCCTFDLRSFHSTFIFWLISTSLMGAASVCQNTRHFFFFFRFCAQKHWKGTFWPVFGVHSGTQTLVKINNKEAFWKKKASPKWYFVICERSVGPWGGKCW